MKTLTMLLAMLMMFTVPLLANGDQVIPIKMKLNGSIMDSGLYDYKGELKELKRFDLDLKGAPGKATARGVGWGGLPIPYDQLPAGNECFDTLLPVDGVVFEEFQMTMDFKDGSMLFGNAVEGYICFAPSIAIGTYSINGGAGRFEGATGWIDVYIETHRFNEEGHPSLVTAETGTLTGAIVMP